MTRPRSGIVKPTILDRLGAAVRLRSHRLQLLHPVAGEHLVGYEAGPTGAALYDAYGGAVVVATAAGTVRFAGPTCHGWTGRGPDLSVSISHAGQVECGRSPSIGTTTEGLAAVCVKPGERVEAGQRIGTMPAAGGRLRFQLCRGRERMDLRPLIRAR
jgi:murein DD-endopeptidase MepM/ murein hydrolase activator NlpD